MSKRKNTRSQAWPDTKATIKVVEDFGGGSRSRIQITGIVQNLGATGFFIETSEIVPIPSRAEISIYFEPELKSSGLKIQAIGETVHMSKSGIGIRFTSIDLNKLQKCIISKMNRLAEASSNK